MAAIAYDGCNKKKGKEREQKEYFLPFFFVPFGLGFSFL